LDDGETIVASIYHRFWLAGRGWAQARELESGDRLRMLGGIASIVRVDDGETVPVFNLDVAQNHSYFVGERDALVHDNTLPNARAPRFDAESKRAGTTP